VPSCRWNGVSALRCVDRANRLVPRRAGRAHRLSACDEPSWSVQPADHSKGPCSLSLEGSFARRREHETLRLSPPGSSRPEDLVGPVDSERFPANLLGAVFGSARERADSNLTSPSTSMGTLPNKVLQRTNAVARAAHSPLASPLNAGPLIWNDPSSSNREFSSFSDHLLLF